VRNDVKRITLIVAHVQVTSRRPKHHRTTARTHIQGVPEHDAPAVLLRKTTTKLLERLAAVPKHASLMPVRESRIAKKQWSPMKLRFTTAQPFFVSSYSNNPLRVATRRCCTVILQGAPGTHRSCELIRASQKVSHGLQPVDHRERCSCVCEVCRVHQAHTPQRVHARQSTRPTPHQRLTQQPFPQDTKRAVVTPA
jgi:hypothetical protein